MYQDHYRSPDYKLWAFTKRFPEYVFYPRVIYTVYKAARMAKAGTYTAKDWENGSRDILKALESVGVNVDIENLSSIRNLKSPCVFVCNHMSALETFILPCIIQPYRNVTFVIKKSLIDYPVFKHVMISRDPIVVGRVNPRDDFKKVMKGGKKRLDHNISVIIFPQTTRSNSLDEKKFNTIGIKLAKYANVPVIPVALQADAWGVGRIIKDAGKIDPQKPVKFSFGKPVFVSGNGKEEHRITYDFIRNKLRSWNGGKE